MTGERRHGTATLKLAISRALPKRMRSKVREVIGLHTPTKDRGNGLASYLMSSVCYEADQHSIVLLLTPDSGLDAFYRQFGFKAIQNNPTLMARQAND